MRALSISLLALLSAAPSMAGSLLLPAADEPLPAEEAFQVSAEASDRQRTTLHFVMPPGYYLYRERSAFALDASEGQVTRIAWPTGVSLVDEHYGEQEVYFETADVDLDLELVSKASFVTVRARFQGCLKDRVCYPPMHRDVIVALPRE